MGFTNFQRAVNFRHAGLVVDGKERNDVVALTLIEEEHFKGKLWECFGPYVDTMRDIGAVGIAVDDVDRSESSADGDDFSPNAAQLVELLTGFIAVGHFGLCVNGYSVTELSRLM